MPRFCGFLRPILPTIFSDSLSYYEEICKLAKVVDEQSNIINELSTRVATLEEQVNTTTE